MMPEGGNTQTELTEGDGRSTSTVTPDSYDSGVGGLQGYGVVPARGQTSSLEVERFGFEQDADRSPFYELMTSALQRTKEKKSMDIEISATMMRAFNNELGHIQQEKRANVLASIGKGLVGAGLKRGATRKGTSAIMGAARRAAGSTAGGQKLIGGAALGAGALGAAGVGAAASR